MSWPTQPKVRLAVTRFAPDKPIAGLSDEQREALRSRRKAEQTKVEPAVYIQELFRPFNIFMYGNFVEVEFIGPLEMGPLEPEPHRCDSIDCVDCWNRAQYFNDYLKAKRLRDGI